MFFNSQSSWWCLRLWISPPTTKEDLDDDDDEYHVPWWYLSLWMIRGRRKEERPPIGGGVDEEAMKWRLFLGEAKGDSRVTPAKSEETHKKIEEESINNNNHLRFFDHEDGNPIHGRGWAALTGGLMEHEIEWKAKGGGKQGQPNCRWERGKKETELSPHTHSQDQVWHEDDYHPDRIWAQGAPQHTQYKILITVHHHHPWILIWFN